MSEFEDLAVEGAAIAAKPEHERFADIIAPEPFYRDVKDLEDPEKTKRKLIIAVLIAGKDRAEYFPNKTSGRFIANEVGTKMINWIGKRIFWEIRKQSVGGNDKQVLYIEKVEDIPIVYSQ